MDDKSFDCFNLEKSIAAIAAALKVAPGQVRAAADLLAAGGTIPFIARYRKEATRGLDEQALRAIDESLAKARELADRKATILKTIDGQGLLTDALRRQIEDCGDKRELEDLYLPFKPKRRTRATIARERGLEPLAEVLLRQEPLGRPRSEILRPYVSPEREVPDEAAALAGACDIVAERSARSCAAARRKRPLSSRCTSIIKNRAAACLRTDFSPCSGARRNRCSG